MSSSLILPVRFIAFELSKFTVTEWWPRVAAPSESHTATLATIAFLTICSPRAKRYLAPTDVVSAFRRTQVRLKPDTTSAEPVLAIIPAETTSSQTAQSQYFAESTMGRKVSTHSMYP